MSKAFCPGSFDPLTVGHIDIIKKCAEIFDSVVVGVGINPDKTYLLSIDERRAYCEDAFSSFNNVSVIDYDGYTVDAALDCGADVIVKGIRNGEDLAYETDMADKNRTLSIERHGSAIETIFIPANPKYFDISSSSVRDCLKCGRDITKYLHNSTLFLSYIK